jgi:hypothetical protein
LGSRPACSIDRVPEQPGLQKKKKKKKKKPVSKNQIGIGITANEVEI